jgi:hypothetical protein
MRVGRRRFFGTDGGTADHPRGMLLVTEFESMASAVSGFGCQNRNGGAHLGRHGWLHHEDRTGQRDPRVALDRMDGTRSLEGHKKPKGASGGGSTQVGPKQRTRPWRQGLEVDANETCAG